MIEGKPFGDRRDLNEEKLSNIVMEKLGLLVPGDEEKIIEPNQLSKIAQPISVGAT